MNLEGRVAVIIGGTSGIGRALALGLADAGAHVVPSARRLDAVADTCAQVQQRGRDTLACTSDVCDAASLTALCSAVLQRFGTVDVLVNCAGRTQRKPSLEVSQSEWHSIIETNLTGTFLSCQVFGRAMVLQRTGSIINIASLASHSAFLEVAAYTASKSAVLGLTRALAIEWAPLGVRVNTISPGVFPTPLNETLLKGTARGQELVMRTPMRRFGAVEELVGAAVYLASDAAGFVTGSNITVDGGFLASGVNQ